MAAEFLPGNPLEGHPRYSLVRHLNRGRHGVVVLAHDKVEDEKVAIKFIVRPAAANKYVEREIINQYKLCHPHVIRLLDVFLIPTHLALVLEYAEMGDLHTYVMSRRGLSEGESRWFFQQIILAIDFCNKMGVANRDVKLENMLLTSGGPPGASPLVKLGDFGFSKDMIHQSAATTRVGTVMYMAPEVLTAPPGGVYDASKADVWSCGVVLYAMLTGVYPFKRVPEDLKLSPAQAVRAALQRILAGDYSIPERISPEAADMIQSLLEQDPGKRLSVTQVMEHTFYTTDLAAAVVGYNEKIIETMRAQLEGDSDEALQHISRVLRDLLGCPLPNPSAIKS